MKTVLRYVNYITACVNAISKGISTVADSWPTDNPFSGGSSTV